MTAAPGDDRLTARFAVADGLVYDGIARVRTAGGVRPMLKFSMTSLRLPGIVLKVSEGGGSCVTSDSAALLRGDVELFTTRLSADLDGAEVTFTVANPPAGLSSNLSLTSVVAEQPLITAVSLRATRSRLRTT